MKAAAITLGSCGKADVAERRTDAVRFDRLNLIFSLAWTVIDAEAAAQDRSAAAEEACAGGIRATRSGRRAVRSWSSTTCNGS